MPSAMLKRVFSEMSTISKELAGDSVPEVYAVEPQLAGVTLATGDDEHVMLWDKFPIWYHLWFLLSLVPLTYVGNSLARGSRAGAPA